MGLRTARNNQVMDPELDSLARSLADARRRLRMKKLITLSLAILVCASPGSLLAHHSLANFDTARAVRVKGTIVEFRRINPHSYIFLDQRGEDGQTRRWAPLKVRRSFNWTEKALPRKV
jgi:hypothetical protein